MRVRLVLGAALVAVAASACGSTAAADRPALLDRAPRGLFGSTTTATVGASPTATPSTRTSSAPPSTATTVHATTGPTTPSKPATPSRPAVRPAVPLGTVGAAPGHPDPLPAGAVALTFDDGPDPRWTPQVLAILRQYHAKATFFVIGIHAQAYPSLVKAEYAAGNGVGNHTWTHPDLTKLPPSQVAAQISQTAAVIKAETGHAPSCLRPPYDAIGAAMETVVAQEHESLMLYDGDPRDWQVPGVQAIVQRVLAEAHPGAVIDMHDAGGDRSQTVAALPQILRGLAARHLVTVPICRT